MWPLLFLTMDHQGCWGAAAIFWERSWLELKLHTSESLFLTASLVTKKYSEKNGSSRQLILTTYFDQQRATPKSTAAPCWQLEVPEDQDYIVLCIYFHCHWHKVCIHCLINAVNILVYSLHNFLSLPVTKWSRCIRVTCSKNIIASLCLTLYNAYFIDPFVSQFAGSSVFVEHIWSIQQGIAVYV